MIKHRRVLTSTIALLVLVFGLATYSGAADEILVGAWNIEFLGRPNQRDNSGKGIPQQPSDLAHYIKNSGVSLLGLEEVCVEPKDASTLTNKTLAETIKLLNSDSGADWKYVMFGGRGKKKKVQLTGMVWNEKILTPVGEPFRVPMKIPARKQGEPIYWDRWATAMKFSAGQGKTDVVIIPVHMKSNRPKKGESEDQAKERTIEQRAKEGKYLVEALGDVRKKFSDEDIIIAGDLNALGTSEKVITVFVEAGFRDLNQGDLVSHISKKHRNSPLDRAFVPAKQPEFSSSEMQVFKPVDMSPEEFRKKLSDHYMIRFKIAVMDDDD